jgi:hypothetical protein
MAEPRKVIIYLNDTPDTSEDASRIVDAETGEVMCYISAVSELHVTNHIVLVHAVPISPEPAKDEDDLDWNPGWYESVG